MTQHAGLLRDILGWDVINWQQAICFWEQHLPQRLDGWRGLELGAASGGLSLYLGLKGAEMTCSDLSNPCDRALPLHQKYGLQVSYQAVDACQLPFADQSLDVVCFKSVLGGIRKNKPDDPKPLIIQEILRVLKPGGLLLFAENLKGTCLNSYFRRKFVPWSQGWEYLDTQTYLYLLQDFQELKTQQTGLLGLLGRNEAQRRLLGHFDQQLPTWLPTDWHYILIALARKGAHHDQNH